MDREEMITALKALQKSTQALSVSFVRLVEAAVDQIALLFQ
jgi:hypothetical protein